MGCTISTDVQKDDDIALQAAQEDELPRNFDPQDAAKILHEAIENRQEELVARFFYKYTDEDYKKLCRVFPYKYSIDVITLASQNLSANASEFVRLRLESRSLSVCNFLHHQLHERPDNFRTNVIGVLCGYHELDLSKVTAEYQRLYHTSLADSLKVGFCGDLLDVLRHIIQPKPKETETVEECSIRLHEAAQTGNLMEGDKEFFAQLKRYSLPFLKNVLEDYIQLYQRDLIVEIEKSSPPGQEREMFATIASIIRHSQLYFSRLINQILKTNEEDSNMKCYYLMFYTMTRAPEALRDLKKAYRIHCFEALADEVREFVKDPVVNVILLKTVLRVSSN